MELVTFARTANEVLILSVLSRGDLYGYQIALEVEEVSGHAVAFNHGTLYPILHALEKEGYIEGRWEEGGSARKRKFYSLTSSGRKLLEKQREGLKLLVSGVMQVLEEKGGGNDEQV